MMQASWPIKMQENKLTEKWQSKKQGIRGTAHKTENKERRKGVVQDSKAEKQTKQGYTTSKSN